MTALFMATAMAVTPTPAAPTHEVLPGESLSLIAQCELGDADRWVELVELNEATITDPNIIEPGWTLVLPEGATGDCPSEPVVQAASVTPSPEARTSRGASEAEASPTPAPPRRAEASPSRGSSSGASGGLASIRACESGGDYGAVSANGQYRGAYQFDRQTWQSVGGSGDPADASKAEQDRRAAMLYEQRGSSPWPSCG